MQEALFFEIQVLGWAVDLHIVCDKYENNGCRQAKGDYKLSCALALYKQQKPDINIQIMIYVEDKYISVYKSKNLTYLSCCRYNSHSC